MEAKNKITINLIQDLATPHNNVLIKQFIGLTDVTLKLWYAESKNQERYQWNQDITQQHLPANIYGKRLNISFLRYCINNKHERFIIVGWMNINTRLLHFLFYILRRPFSHWTDMPNPNIKGRTHIQKFVRWANYKFLLYSRCMIFCVGSTTIEYFRLCGFPDRKLINLPIFVDIDKNLPDYRLKRTEIRNYFDVPHHGYLISTGSRLIRDKGFDLLIQAIYKLPQNLKSKIKTVIVGNGDELLALSKQIETLKLDDVIKLEGWMDIDDFKVLIANSDIFLHPARFDSYGATTLGMALEVAVIGSTGAGAAVDRIENGVNGFLYDPTDIRSLANYIQQLLSDDSLKKRIAKAGRITAEQWHPSRGVDILLKNSI